MFCIILDQAQHAFMGHRPMIWQKYVAYYILIYIKGVFYKSIAVYIKCKQISVVGYNVNIKSLHMYIELLNSLSSTETTACTHQTQLLYLHILHII